MHSYFFLHRHDHCLIARILIPDGASRVELRRKDVTVNINNQCVMVVMEIWDTGIVVKSCLSRGRRNDNSVFFHVHFDYSWAREVWQHCIEYGNFFWENFF